MKGIKQKGRAAEICSREDCKGISVLEHYLAESCRTAPKDLNIGNDEVSQVLSIL